MGFCRRATARAQLRLAQVKRAIADLRSPRWSPHHPWSDDTTRSFLRLPLEIRRIVYFYATVNYCNLLRQGRKPPLHVHDAPKVDQPAEIYPPLLKARYFCLQEGKKIVLTLFSFWFTDLGALKFYMPIADRKMISSLSIEYSDLPRAKNLSTRDSLLSPIGPRAIRGLSAGLEMLPNLTQVELMLELPPTFRGDSKYIVKCLDKLTETLPKVRLTLKIAPGTRGRRLRRTSELYEELQDAIDHRKVQGWVCGKLTPV